MHDIDALRYELCGHQFPEPDEQAQTAQVVISSWASYCPSCRIRQVADGVEEKISATREAASEV
jgi:hypothetical protein